MTTPWRSTAWPKSTNAAASPARIVWPKASSAPRIPSPENATAKPLKMASRSSGRCAAAPTRRVVHEGQELLVVRRERIPIGDCSTDCGVMPRKPEVPAGGIRDPKGDRSAAPPCGALCQRPRSPPQASERLGPPAPSPPPRPLQRDGVVIPRLGRLLERALLVARASTIQRLYCCKANWASRNAAAWFSRAVTPGANHLQETRRAFFLACSSASFAELVILL